MIIVTRTYIFKTFEPFTDCISKTNNTQIDIAKSKDIVMPMYNLIEYNNNYSKTSRHLWPYYRDEPNDNIEVKITETTPDNDNKISLR